MRILMLAQFYPPTIGGEETYVRNLSVALAQRGHEVAVATLLHSGLPEFEVCDGVRIYRIRGLVQHIPGLFSERGRKHAPPFPDVGLLWALRHVVLRERPQIVHAHNWIVRSFIPIKQASSAKLVMSLHDYSLVCAKKNLMNRSTVCDGPAFGKCLDCVSDHYGVVKGVPTLVANWAMGAAEKAAVDMFLPVSQTVAVLDGLTGSRLPYQVIPNFLPDDAHMLRESDDPRLRQLPDGPFLLFVGDLRHVKGVDILLKAYKNLKDAPPLVLIGRQCPDTPSELPPNVFKFNDWPHDAVMHAWQRALIGLAPSVWHETFGYVVLEAMTMGRPVIGSRMGGIADLILDGETGLLVPPGDAAALEQAIRRLLNDPAIRERMGTASRQRAAEFRASAILPRIENVYMSCLDRNVQRYISSCLQSGNGHVH